MGSAAGAAARACWSAGVCHCGLDPQSLIAYGANWQIRKFKQRGKINSKYLPFTKFFKE
jgi:hypothetical protein